MKHTVQFKMPKLFGKKTVETETEVKTEVEVKVDENKIKTFVKVAVPVVVVGAAGYVVGYNRGMIKALDKQIIVLK